MDTQKIDFQHIVQTHLLHIYAFIFGCVRDIFHIFISSIIDLSIQ